MTRDARRAPHDGHGGELAHAVEGYLLVQAHHEQALREAGQLCARLPWLTTAQADDLTRHYVRQRADLTRQMLQTTAERAAELRGEYEERFALLRQRLLRRHVAGACTVLACVSAAGTAAYLLGL